ncbi:MAG TPA: tetratricopeptide repeat protein [Candidatus Acidoferrales bacterium]|jgi:tetratricopeptide (TPR) repeat protein|nr:tetratricopeptide repeat protein [Candidatus Acidoferrales bacterium]
MRHPRSLFLALLFPLLCPCAFAQTAPMGHAEILGRLAVGYSPSYVAYLVKIRGVSFSVNADFLDDVQLAGGNGVLVERLSSAEPDSSAASSYTADDKPVDHLAKCAELIHTGDADSATQDCRAAIDEDPQSPWPLLATAEIMTQKWGPQTGEQPNPQELADLRALVQKAAALAPNLTLSRGFQGAQPPSPHVVTGMQGISSADPEGWEFSQMNEEDVEPDMSAFAPAPGAGSADAPLVTSDTGDGPGAHVMIGAVGPIDGPGTLPLPSGLNEETAVDPWLLRQIQIEPDLASNHIGLAENYLSFRDFDKAQAEIEEALRLEPDNARIHARLANLYFARHDADNGLAELREAVRIVPDGDRQHMYLAQSLDALGRRNEAVAELQTIIAIHPTHVQPSNALIALYLDGDDRKSAVDELRRSLKASSETFNDEAKFVDARFDDLNRLAALLQDNRELDAAAEQYLYILRFKPDDAGVHNDYGNVLLAQRHLDDAIGQYREALRLEPDMSTAHHNIGLCLAMKNNVDDAIDEFRQALELNPNEPHTQFFLGNALAQKGDLNGAMNQFEQILQKNPNDSDAHQGLGGIFLQRKDTFDAINEFKKALAAEPDSPTVENNLAWIYATADDPQFRNPAEALTLARKAVESSREPVPAFLDTLAEALLLNGHASEALATETKALSLDPKNSELQSRLARFRAAAQPMTSKKP